MSGSSAEHCFTCMQVSHVLVVDMRHAKGVSREGTKMVRVRDEWYDAVVPSQSSQCEPEWVDAEHPLFLLYTSGSTGKPKGVQHTTAGYMMCEFHLTFF